MVKFKLCSRHGSRKTAEKAAEKIGKKGIKTKVSRIVLTNIWTVNVPVGTPRSVCPKRR